MSTASDAVSDFLHHAAVRDLPDIELFELKAQAFDLMAEQAAEENDAVECRAVAVGARAAAARILRSQISAADRYRHLTYDPFTLKSRRYGPKSGT